MVWEWTRKKREKRKKALDFFQSLWQRIRCVYQCWASQLIISHHSLISLAVGCSNVCSKDWKTTHMRLQREIKRINGTLYHQMRDYNDDDSCWERRIESENESFDFSHAVKTNNTFSPRALIVRENSNYYSSHNKYLWKVTSSWMRLADSDDDRLDLTTTRLAESSHGTHTIQQATWSQEMNEYDMWTGSFVLCWLFLPPEPIVCVSKTS